MKLFFVAVMIAQVRNGHLCYGLLQGKIVNTDLRSGFLRGIMCAYVHNILCQRDSLHSVCSVQALYVFFICTI